MSTMYALATDTRDTTVTVDASGVAVVRVRDHRSGQGHSLPLEFPHLLSFQNGDDHVVTGTDELDELLTSRNYLKFSL